MKTTVNHFSSVNACIWQTRSPTASLYEIVFALIFSRARPPRKRDCELQKDAPYHCICFPTTVHLIDKLSTLGLAQSSPIHSGWYHQRSWRLLPHCAPPLYKSRRCTTSPEGQSDPIHPSIGLQGQCSTLFARLERSRRRRSKL